MKKSLLALAALTAFAGVASAQSSVTLFGIIDMSLKSVENGSTGSVKSLASDGNASNRIGFRGVEDLGGGLKAGFWIEGGMDPSTGGTGQTWQRRSTASLMGGFGEIRLGRDYTASFWNYTYFDPFGTNGVGNVLNVVSTLGSGATTLVRANNTVSYFLPAMGGLYGQLQVAASENTTGNKYLGGRIGYAAGPLNVAGAWGNTKKTGTMLNDYTDKNIGVSYNMGFMTLMGQYAKRDYTSLSSKTILLGALVPMGNGTLKASYTKASGTAALAHGYDAKQLALGYVYDLSKRTALFAHYARIDNDGTSANGANFTIGGGNAGMARGANSTGYEFGIRHSF